MLARTLNSLAQASLPDAEQPEALEQLVDLIDGLCPLQAFAIWSRQEGDTCCLLAPRALPAPLYEQLLVRPTHVRDHLATLRAADGWCKAPVEAGPVGWLLARTDAEHRPLLQLLLTVLANRFGCLQCSHHLSRQAMRQPEWPRKLERITRLLHQVHRLPSSQLWTLLTSALGDWLDTRELLLLQRNNFV